MFSYVRKQKASVRLIGIQVNDVYSLKRRTLSQSVAIKRNTTSYCANNVTDVFDKHISLCSPSLNSYYTQWPERHAISSKTDGKKTWRPDESRYLTDDTAYKTRYQHLDRETRIPGHVSASDRRSQRLGKVANRSHLKQLIQEEERMRLQYLSDNDFLFW
ncbi:hypothetical protein DPMN_110940 [Dreissena polymorpha]|uniref:Uncharacterized protein n=1 Tax=Dreissena polymorpha TaxID=45954 RepID=A0A9D4KCX9_DREPO|nr:hypothetical protein DPMN_110940 [Dreissena polymorpha]